MRRSFYTFLLLLILAVLPSMPQGTFVGTIDLDGDGTVETVWQAYTGAGPSEASRLFLYRLTVGTHSVSRAMVLLRQSGLLMVNSSIG